MHNASMNEDMQLVYCQRPLALRECVLKYLERDRWDDMRA